jgi:hypothetical protein
MVGKTIPESCSQRQEFKGLSFEPLPFTQRPPRFCFDPRSKVSLCQDEIQGRLLRSVSHQIDGSQYSLTEPHRSEI